MSRIDKNPPAFWQNRRVMVTGGNGFLGKHLTGKLYTSGADIFGSSLGWKQILGAVIGVLVAVGGAWWGWRKK